MFGLGVISYSTGSFKFTITTAGINELFTLPLINGGIYNFVANWGDGSANSVITAYNVNNTHTYAAIGTYVISMSGVCTQFAFNNAGTSRTRVKNILTVGNDMGFTVLNFYGCTSLTGVTSSMSNLKSLTTAYNFFNGCSLLASVPAGIFDGSTKILNFGNAFLSCIALTAVPADLFKYNVAVTNFAGIFQGCTNLTTIPANLFRYNTLATDLSGMFRACTKLTTIPVDSFKYNKLVTTFSNLCMSCSLLASIPVDLFRYNTGVTTYNSAFRGCPVLASIPAGLFSGNTNVTTFTYVFYGCTALTSIPVDLFRYNLAVTTFDNAFRGCTALATIPTNLFRYNTLAINFNNTLNGCPKAQFNINIFYASGETGTRFLNQSVNFTYCFYRDTFTGIQGTAPDLWNCNFGTGTPTKTQAFGGAGNSIASLSNYASIPSTWIV